MGQSRLPDGVPSDNLSKNLAVGGAGRDEAFQAPDTATPDFAIPATNDVLTARRDHGAPAGLGRLPEPAPTFAKVIIETGDDEYEEEEEDEDRNGLFHAHPSAPMLILIALGLALIAIAAFAVSRRETPDLPNCASQPDWNQYNCRTS